MPTTRKTTPLPLPGAELARMKEYLSTEYGNELWQGDGQRILVIRVPRDDPDIVNDLEQAVEYLTPSDVTDTPTLLLVGQQRTHILPIQPLRDLMDRRVQFDRRQCQMLRTQLKPGEQKLFKAPEDPRRLVRLAIRIKRDAVRDFDDADLQALTQILGPVATTAPYQEVRAVYLIAGKDDVRIDSDLFFHDLKRRFDEDAERHQLAQEIVQKEQAKRLQQEADRQALLGRPSDRYNNPSRVAVAPMRRADTAAWENPEHTGDLLPRATAADSSLAAPAHTIGTPSSRDRAAMYAHLDALRGVVSGPQSRGPVSAPVGSAPEHRGLTETGQNRGHETTTSGSATHVVPNPSVPTPPRAAAPVPRPIDAQAPAVPIHPTLLAIQQVLTQAGFDTLLSPRVGAHRIDLAGERPSGFPQRVIVFTPERLTRAVADQVLAAARDVQADQALVVCNEADPDARKRFIATSAKWMPLAEVATLQL